MPPRTFAHPEPVQYAVASADGKKVYTAAGNKVRTWDVAKGAIEKEYAGHAAAVTAVAVSPNGQILVSGGADPAIRFRDQKTGKEEHQYGHDGGAITSLAINAAGNQLLSAEAKGHVKVWSLPPVPPKALPHGDAVTCVAVSADGAKVLTGGSDKTVRLWNAATGAKERDFTGPAGKVLAVAFSPDGKYIAAASEDKAVTVWTTADGKQVKKYALPAAGAAVAFSPANKTFAVGGADNIIRVFDVTKDKEEKALTGHTGTVTGLAYLGKGEQLLSGSADATVQLWNVAQAKSEKQFKLNAPVLSLSVSKNGGTFAAAMEKMVLVRALDAKGDGDGFAANKVRSASLSPDGAKLAVATADNRVTVYNAAAGRAYGVSTEFFTHDGVQAVAFHPDGKRLVSGGGDKAARVWTQALLWQTQRTGKPEVAIYSPKGDLIIAAGDKAIKIYQAADGKELRTIAANDGPVNRLSLSADGTRLTAAGARDKLVKVWDTAAKGDDPLATFEVGANAHAVISPNGQRVAVTSVGQDLITNLQVFDLVLGREVQTFRDKQLYAEGFLPDNRTLLVSSPAGKNVQLLDVNVLTAFDAHKGGVVSAQYHSSGALILTAGKDNTVKLWDVVKSNVLKTKTFGPFPDPVRAAVFSRDFTQVGAAVGKSVKVWNVADGKEVLTLPHPAEVAALSFSADKTRIATAAADKQTRLWDAATGKELQFFAQPGAVQTVLYHPNNAAILSGGTDKVVSIDAPAIQRLIPAATAPLHALTLTPNATHVVTAGADKTVTFWNLANGNKEKTFGGATVTLFAVALNKANTLLAAGGADKRVRLYNLADGKEIKAVALGGAVKTLQFSPNNLALAAGSADKTLQVWSTPFTPGQPLSPDLLKPLQTFTHDGAVTDVAFAADNATLYASSLGNSVKAFRVAADAPTKSFGHPNQVYAVAFSPNGNLLATGNVDGKIRIYDVAKATLVKEINAHTVKDMTQIYNVAFTPDGKQIASCSYDNSIKLFDATSGALVKEFKAYKVKDFEKGHRDPVFSIAISPDGKFLASGSGGIERVIKIWNLADGSVVRDLNNPKLKRFGVKPPPKSHPGWIYALRFTKDGKLVSVGDAPINKGYLAVWNPQDGKLLYGEELPLGSFYALALTANGDRLAIAAGPRQTDAGVQQWVCGQDAREGSAKRQAAETGALSGKPQKEGTERRVFSFCGLPLSASAIKGVSMKTIVFDFGNVLGFFDHYRTLNKLTPYTDMAAADMLAAVYGAELEDDFESGASAPRSSCGSTAPCAGSPAKTTSSAPPAPTSSGRTNPSAPWCRGSRRRATPCCSAATPMKSTRPTSASSSRTRCGTSTPWCSRTRPACASRGRSSSRTVSVWRAARRGSASSLTTWPRTSRGPWRAAGTASCILTPKTCRRG